MLLEPLEGRCLLSVTLGNPTASSWSFGQTESIGATVVDAVTNLPPPANTEVDLLNVGLTAGSASQILVKGATDGSGNVSFGLTNLNVGTYNLEAEFTDSAGTLETSNPVPVAVTQAATTTTLASSDPAPVYGEPLTITATVAPSVTGYGTPTGCVVFTISSIPGVSISEGLNSSGVATLTIPSNSIPPTPAGTPQVGAVPGVLGLPVGQNTITAVYQGDIDFAQSTATPLSLPVAQASTTTTLTSSAGSSPVAFGQPVVFKAMVQVVSPGAGVPSGFVSFVDTSTDPSTVLGKAYVTWTPKIAAANTDNTGLASFVDANLPVGTHTIVAYYLGDQNYLPSDSTAAPDSVTIVAASPSPSSTVVWASPDPALYGSTVTLAATVMPGNFGPVIGATPPAGPNSPPPVMPPIFQGLTGSVQFLDNNVDLGSPVQLVNGQAELSVPSTTPLIAALPLGTDAITAVYIPDAAATFAGSTSQPFYEVIFSTTPPPAPVPTTTVVTPTQQTITAGSEASFVIAVSPTTVPDTDTVNVYDVSPKNAAGGITCSTLLGTATYDSTNSDWTFTTTTPLSVGNHMIDAVFGGDANFLPSQGFASVQVVPSNPPPTPVATTTTVTPQQQQVAVGSEASFTVTVTPAVPSSDTVSMYDVSPAGNAAGSVTAKTLLGYATYESSNGVESLWTFTTSITLSSPLRAAGLHVIDAVFGGDPAYAPSQGLATVLVVPPTATTPPSTPVATTTTVAATQQQITAGSPDSFTITVSPATVSASTFSNSDMVYVYDLSSAANPAGGGTGAMLLGTATYDNNHEWTFSVTALPPGPQAIYAVFGGDANFAPSQGWTSVLVVQPST